MFSHQEEFLPINSIANTTRLLNFVSPCLIRCWVLLEEKLRLVGQPPGVAPPGGLISNLIGWWSYTHTRLESQEPLLARQERKKQQKSIFGL